MIIELLRILQSQWNRVSGFSGEYRAGIPFTDVKIAAELIGVRLNYKKLRMLSACMTAITNDDIKGIQERNSK